MRYSFLIPTSGRLDRVRATLGALSALEAPDCSVEAIVVVDGSPSDSIVDDQNGCLSVTVLAQAPGGPARARNRAAAHATGDWLIFLDDDCQLKPNFLHVLGERLDPSALVAFGGQPRTPSAAGIWSLATHLVVEAFVASQRDGRGALGFLPSQNLILHRSAWLASGGFNEDFRQAGGEDREFCSRWIQKGGTLERVDALAYVHDHPLTLGGFLTKHFQYGRGAAGFGATFRRPLFPGYPGFLLELARLALSFRPVRRLPALTSALALSQIMTVSGVLAGRR